MKKLILITICAFVSFAFADSSTIENAKEVKGTCDGYGGNVSVSITIDCDGDGINEVSDSSTTCGDFVDAWYDTYNGFCGSNPY